MVMTGGAGDWLLATDVDCCKYHTATGPRTTAPLAQVHTGGAQAGKVVTGPTEVATTWPGVAGGLLPCQ